MSDRIPDPHDTPPDAARDEEVDTSRRRLTGAALGASAVFTLASRPVWANQCTISGMQSGNLSAPPGPACAGCTPGYWKQKQHFDSWPAPFVPVGTGASTFNAVFGVEMYKRPNGEPYTLLEVMKELNGNGDPVSTNLGFHAVAALLNAAHPEVNYGYTSGEIIDLFRNNLHRAAALKDSLAMLNERGCPLN